MSRSRVAHLAAYSAGYAFVLLLERVQERVELEQAARLLELRQATARAREALADLEAVDLEAVAAAHTCTDDDCCGDALLAAVYADPEHPLRSLADHIRAAGTA